MSQKSVTTTTSFIISSTESLNKHALSLSSQSSSGSSDNMTTGSEGNQYFITLNPASNNNNMMINQKPQQNSTHSYSSNQPRDFIYNSNGTGPINNTRLNSSTNQIHCNGSPVVPPPLNATSTDNNIYTIYHHNHENNLQFSNSNPTIGGDNKQSYPLTQSSVVGNDLNVLLTNGVTGGDNGPITSSRSGDSPLGHTNSTSNNNNGTYSPKPNTTIQSFQNNNNNKPVINSNQRLSLSSLESSNSGSLMPLNVKSMLLHGVTGNDVIRNWLTSIKCEEYVGNFVHNGYDMLLLKRMTPQDLTAIGCKSPALRKKLLAEIKKLNLEDDIPETRPHSLEKWLELLKLSEYHVRLCNEGYNTIDKVCELTWEDLEEIGVTKLGHQKRLLLGIEKIVKFDKQLEERQNDYAIYDVHPNYKISLNQSNQEHRLSTLGRSTVRSGFFQTRPGANLDHRGLPIATVMPALKHVNNSLANLDISHQVITKPNVSKSLNGNNRLSMSEQATNQMLPIGQQINNQENSIKMNDCNITTTMKRNPPPLPPIRSNSLKIVTQDLTTLGGINNANDNNSQMNFIYGSNYGVGGSYGHQPPTTVISTTTPGSTSFLRTPKLGTLTATTNKMLMHGGHIQTVVGVGQARSIMPVREAPLPPVPLQPPTIIEKSEEEAAAAAMQQQASFNSPLNQVDCSTLMNTSAISHQLASADEFPPPPPSQ